MQWVKLYLKFALTCAAIIGLVENVYGNEAGFLIATNVNVDGKVMRLTLPVGGVPFQIGWSSSNGMVWQAAWARQGTHLYETRHQPTWIGTVKELGVSSFTGIRGDVITPTFQQEMELFFTPEIWKPSIISAVGGHTLFGRPWTEWLLCIMLLLAVLLFCRTRRLVAAVFFSFVVVMVLADLRNTYDHLTMIRQLKQHRFLQDYKTFMRDAEDFGRANGARSWTDNNLTPLGRHLALYTLAEYPYIPPTAALSNNVVVFTVRDGPFFKRGVPR